MGRTNRDTRVKIIALREHGLSVRQLQHRFHISRRGIQRLCTKYRDTQSVSDLQRSGRPRLSTKQDDRCLRRMCVKNPRWSSRTLRQMWQREYGINATARTVRSRLVTFGLKGRIAKKKPLLSKKNKRLRLTWARQHRDWSDYQWMQTFFSDETPVYLIQSNQRRYVRCSAKDVLSPRHLRPTVQAGGGKILLWAGFSGHGLTSLAPVDGTVNTDTYIKLLTKNLLPLDLPDKAVTFQQDNAPAHKSHRTRTWLTDHGFDLLPWPAQSPDLNPMENTWAYLKEHLEERCDITNVDDLWRAIQEEWASIPLDYFEKLARSMPRRISKVIAAKGGYTRY